MFASYTNVACWPGYQSCFRPRERQHKTIRSRAVLRQVNGTGVINETIRDMCRVLSHSTLCCELRVTKLCDFHLPCILAVTPFFRYSRQSKMPICDVLNTPAEANHDVSSSQPTEVSNLGSSAYYEPVNAISVEVRNMILKWEKAKTCVKTKQEHLHISYQNRQQVSSVVLGPDLQPPPQRYRRATKRAHVG